MGNPKFPRKKYTTPLHPWKEERIKSERELLKKYGLKNHKEVWKAKTYLGRYRHQARELLAKMGAKDPQVKKESDQLLLHLTRLGVLPAGSSLDDVLALETESVLSRRLQTLVYLKGLSSTPDQSRQLISHGHIAVGSRKVTIPSYMVIKEEENDISYTGKSPLNELSHPARPKTDMYTTGVPVEKPPQQPAKPSEEPKKKEGPQEVAEKPSEPTKTEDIPKKPEETLKVPEKQDEKPADKPKDTPAEEKPESSDAPPKKAEETPTKPTPEQPVEEPKEAPKDEKPETPDVPEVKPEQSDVPPTKLEEKPTEPTPEVQKVKPADKPVETPIEEKAEDKPEKPEGKKEKSSKKDGGK